MEVILNKFNAICFLDIDGCLNSQLFYNQQFKHLEYKIPFYRTVKKHLLKLVKSGKIQKLDYYKSMIDVNTINMLNDFCNELNIGVVISSTWRLGHTIEELQEIFKYCGATFTIIDKTPYTGYERGTEISKWLKENCMKWFGVHYYDFYKYCIIDDDSDMLLNQQDHFFQTDNYCGLTPTIIYKAKRFLTHKTF